MKKDDLVCGFLFTEKDFDYFKVTSPEKHKLETRYDEKTGKKLKNKIRIVVEEEETSYIFKNIKSDDIIEFLEELCGFLNCKYSYSNYLKKIVLYPSKMGNFNSGNEISLPEASTFLKEFDHLYNKFLKESICTPTHEYPVIVCIGDE